MEALIIMTALLCANLFLSFTNRISTGHFWISCLLILIWQGVILGKI